MHVGGPTYRRGIRHLLGATLSRVVRGLPFGVSRRLLGGGLTVGCYHAVTDDPAPHLKHLIPCRSPATFRRDLEFMAGHYHPVSLADVLGHVLRGRPLRREAFLLTFDDGLTEVAEFAAPICRAMGFPATLFLATDATEQKTLLYRHKASLLVDAISKMERGEIERRGLPTKETLIAIPYSESARLDELASGVGVDFGRYLREKKPYLDASQVRGLIADGFTLGAHSLDHPWYATIPLAEQLRQTTESLAALRRLFGIDYRAFAFPFLSDGVAPVFYDTLFAQDAVDLIFCIGEITRPAPRNIARVWLESSRDGPVEAMFRESHFVKLKGMLSKK